MSANTLLNSLAIGGYKSFGSLQHFEKFSKINLIIGQNNVGKSNVFKFLTKVYPLLAEQGKLELELGDRHFPESRKFEAGFVIDESLFKQCMQQKIRNLGHHQVYIDQLLTSFFFKLSAGTSKAWNYFDEIGAHTKTDKYRTVLDQFNDNELSNLWSAFTTLQGGGSSE